jgi:hypothetical protein
MKLPKFDFEHTIQRVSQMRRLALSLREAYEKQYKLDEWLARFDSFRALPSDQFPMKLAKRDFESLRAGFREHWAKGDYHVIIEVADKLPVEALRSDHVLAAFAGAAREKIKVSS